ncbi:PKD domain-containing protein [Bowmanella sp. Y26]|uniref:PKD domain-containing protein n=1 Tax=Bowmanella yangjiangensis TaxID=2811230 RepID=UPI001BDC8F2F|nr:carboxypeptidase-like regulatory domain-containing protein [Bowmanella yangjiangensis]MBT1063785.1 PKD domain-containing protein [Bowmanella yangjiangensis]
MNTQLKVLATSIFVLLSGCGGSGGDAPAIEVRPNLPPVANVVTSHTRVEVGELAHFDASASQDPEQSSLRYHWKIQDAGGQDWTPADASQAVLEFNPQQSGSYHITLTVTDSQGATNSQKVLLEVSQSQRHSLSIKTTKAAKVGEVVELEAVFTHMLSDKVTPKYNWTLVAKPAGSLASIQEPQQIQSQFLADAVGDYDIMLSMQLGNIIKREVKQRISIHKAGDVPPQAKIDTRNFSQLWVGDSLTLTSLSTDADNDGLSYQWQVTGAKAQPHPANLPSFVFEPDALAIYQVCLTVNDGKHQDTDCVDIKVTNENRAPVASFDLAPGNDGGALKPNQNIALISQASDPDGDNLEYEWRVLSSPAESVWNLDSSNADAPVFNANMAGEYQLQLRVYDQKQYSPAFIKVIKLHQSSLPTVRISTNAPSVTVNQWASLHAFSDVEDESVRFTWHLLKQPEGANAQLDGESLRTLNIKTDLVGEYLLHVIATTSQGQSAPATILLVADDNLPPVARLAGQIERNVLVGDPVSFDAAISYDPEGQSLSYNWRVFEEATQQIIESQLDGENFNFSPKHVGSYRVFLTVSDGLKTTETAFVVRAVESLPEQLELTGILLDEANQPVSGVSVATNYIKIRQGYTGFYQTYTDKSGQYRLSFDRPSEGDWEPGVRVGFSLVNGYQDFPVTLDSNNVVNLGVKKVAVLQEVIFQARFCDNATSDNYQTLLRGRGSDNTDFAVKSQMILSVSRDVPNIKIKLLAPAIFRSLNSRFTFNGSTQFEHLYDSNGTKTLFVDICEP